MKTFKQFLKEGDTSHVVVYGGRFQPMHKGHKAVYDKAASVFGEDKVYVVTSNKTNTDEKTGKISPYGFEDKLKFISGVHGIPSDRVIQSSGSPIFSPKEVVERFPEHAIVHVVGDKDVGRYEKVADYTEVKGPSDVKPGGKHYFNAGSMEDGVSSTDVRAKMKGASKDEFKKLFGGFDQDAYDLAQR